MLDIDFSSFVKFFICLRIFFGCLWGFVFYCGLDVGGCVVDVVFLACVVLVVYLVVGVEMLFVDGMDVEGGCGKRRGVGGRGGGGSDSGGGRGREEVGGVEMGRENVISCGGGGLGGERGRGKVVKVMGGLGRGGCGRGVEMLGGWGAILKEFFFGFVFDVYVGVFFLEFKEFKIRGFRGGESFKV